MCGEYDPWQALIGMKKIMVWCWLGNPFKQIMVVQQKEVTNVFSMALERLL